MIRTEDKNIFDAVLVGFDSVSLEELGGLSKTLGIRVKRQFQFQKKDIHPGYYLTPGRLDMIREEVSAGACDSVIFDVELSPAQYKNIEKYLNCVIVDRTELILQIFANHARTRQAKLQIEIAQLRYLLPRLRKMWTHFSRIYGGIGGHGGFGETQLEIDRRRLESRIQSLEKKLKSIGSVIDREIRARRNCYKVALVGYTNVGKSTLLNCLTGANVLTDDKLFATLDTVTRRIKTVKGVPIVVTDTVGFIRNLPHHLVASFTSTLTEAREADLLVYVVDVREGRFARQLETIDQVLESMKIVPKSRVIVFNKIDGVRERYRIGELKDRYKQAYFVSAVKNTGIKKFVDGLVERAERSFVKADIALRFDEGGWVNVFKKSGRILRVKYTPEGMHVSVILPEDILNHFYENRRPGNASREIVG